ncbi:MAG: ABC transporter permease [Bdellovibrionales bacterium]|jgi:phospholipid/cholesterol/gamma-HCH transport system permease protein|nr:ABC transporter permease [Bdellovibrionales bacterium]MBT3525440.1 ABC transporter permease [Bdellovibrionales bacterium]MBT7669809.1 ABC transporter permease [Bdellovibrionales bacterium]MBT7767047.1 ABC transporter permease [Bdellovibrionales bacterium]
MLRLQVENGQTKMVKGRTHRQEYLRVLLQQIYFTFNQALPLVLIIASIVGAAVAFQARFTLSFLGTDAGRMGEILVFILFRELTPLLTSLIVIARSVTAVSSELATMTVQQEIEALEFIGIDINRYLLLPRIVAGAISLFSLSFVFWMISLIGSWVGVNWSSYWPFDRFLEVIAQALTPMDIIFFVLKGVLTGAVVFYLACRIGLSVRNASFEVPIVTNHAVVDTLFVALGIQIFLSAIFYFLFGVTL